MRENTIHVVQRKYFVRALVAAVVLTLETPENSEFRFEGIGNNLRILF